METLVRADVIRRLTFTAIIIVGGAFRFHGLHWNDHSWPHPDERAMVSQTVEMLVADNYRPTIHTWGHFGYYSALFAHKAYAHIQSQAPALPNLREASDGWLMAVGIGLTLFVCLLYEQLRRLRTAWQAAAGTLTAVALVSAWPRVEQVMLGRVAADFADVAITGRFVAALVSTLSLALVYALGARLYTPVVGLLAAAFLAVSLRAVQLAHFFAVEPLQTFSLLLALLAAAALYRLHTRPRTGRADAAAALVLYIALGIAIGMGMASKFSSAPIFALPIVLHVLLLRLPTRIPPLALHASLPLCFISALATWYALHPYAWELAFEPWATARAMPGLSERWLHILFSRDFAAQIAEQSRMVQGDGGGPWVQQFADTTPYLTAMLEMLRWSFGWPLGLICVGGLVYTAVRSFIRPRAEDLLLLSYAGVAFVILGSFKASFPRYTLPVIAVACVLGARTCVELRQHRYVKHLATTAALIGVVSGAVYCSAYMRIYSAPHSWTTASLWIYKNVPPVRPDGAPTRIAHEEWDDEIPVSVPPYVNRYGSVRMAPYDGDGSEKAARLAQALADSDWIALPTSRLYSTILKVADRYPVTAAYYRLLFSGRLGFTLRKTVYQPPELWGLQLYDLTADESHYVYDHPKAVIFEKVETLGPDTLARRIVSESNREPAVSRAAVMRMRESVSEQLQNLWRDPYQADALVTAAEVDATLAKEPGVARERFRSQLSALRPYPAVAFADVRYAADVGQAGEALSAPALRKALQELEAVPAYRAHDLAALARRHELVPDEAVRARLVQIFSAFITATHVSRSALLRSGAQMDWAAPQSAIASTPREQRGLPVDVIDTRGRLWQLWDILKWVAILELLGLAVLPATLWLFAAMPDRGFGLSRILGWVVTTYVACAMVLLRPLTSLSLLAPLALMFVALCAWLPPRLRPRAASLPPLRIIVVTELLFAVTLAAFAVVRAYNPEIYWGEKTMDFSLFNAVMRAGTLPPYDAWFAGVDLNYYYYGYYLIAVLTHLAATPTAIAYNLSMAAIPALTLTAAFSIAYNLTRSLRWGLAGVATVGLLANPDAVFQVAEFARTGAGTGSLIEQSYATYGRTLGGIIAVAQRSVHHFVSLFTATGAPSMWDSYWASSRALGPGMINEYPLWSWLFGDLHAHVIVMPVSLLCLSMIALLFSMRRASADAGTARHMLAFLILALILGTQLASNSWDFFAYAGLLVIGLLASAPVGRVSPAVNETSWTILPGVQSREQPGRPGWTMQFLIITGWVLVWPALCRLHPYWLGLFADRWIGFGVAVGWVVVSRFDAPLRRALEAGATRMHGLLKNALIPVIATVVVSVLLFASFHAAFDPAGASLRWNRDGNIQMIHAVRHFGLFMLLTVIWIVLHVSHTRRALVLLATAVGATAALLTGLGWWSASGGLALYALFVAAALAVATVDERVEHRFAGVLLIAGWGLAAVSELVVLSDRMNTVFKLYHPAWMFLALGSVAALGTSRPAWRQRPRHVRHGALAVVSVAVLICLAGTYRAVDGVVTRKLKISNTPTLDGLDFLRHSDHERELLEAASWLNDRAEGAPVVAEAFTNRGYDDSARIAKYTGLPIVLGWPHHVSQRGRPVEQIAERAEQLQRLYTTRDGEGLRHIASRYRIRYIVVGDLERQQYGDAERSLGTSPVTREVFRSSSGRYVIFEVVAK
jgi:YYY domain-containing protein